MSVCLGCGGELSFLWIAFFLCSAAVLSFLRWGADRWRVGHVSTSAGVGCTEKKEKRIENEKKRGEERERGEEGGMT